jgi:hypothetical protein
MLRAGHLDHPPWGLDSRPAQGWEKIHSTFPEMEKNKSDVSGNQSYIIVALSAFGGSWKEKPLTE